jgi:4-hydroxybenzoate polyprenyltransferase
VPTSLKSLLRAMRPHQWVKNGFVLVPLIFARRLTDPVALLDAGLAFAAFCAVASAIYLINDSADVERDRSHPTKRTRPIASGAISVRLALVTAAVLAPAGLLLAAQTRLGAVIALAIYLVVNLLYSSGLKHVALLDVFIIAFGFLLRVIAGALAVGVGISPWLLVCTFFVALFMAFGKRRAELVDLGDAATDHRAALADYTPGFIDKSLAALMAMTVMSYALYTIDRDVIARLGTDALVTTVPIVLFGVLRYLFQVHRGEGGSPTLLVLRDRVLQATVALYIVVVTVAIYSGVQLGLVLGGP